MPVLVREQAFCFGSDFHIAEVVPCSTSSAWKKPKGFQSLWRLSGRGSVGFLLGNYFKEKRASFGAFVFDEKENIFWKEKT